MSAGTRFRIPRRSKKAQRALYGDRRLTPGQRRLLRRMLVMKPLGWRNIRACASHVAMGDTTRLRHRERADRARAIRDRLEDRAWRRSA